MKNIKQLFKCLFCFHDWEYEICKKCGKIKRYEKY